MPHLRSTSGVQVASLVALVMGVAVVVAGLRDADGEVVENRRWILRLGSSASDRGWPFAGRCPWLQVTEVEAGFVSSAYGAVLVEFGRRRTNRFLDLLNWYMIFPSYHLRRWRAPLFIEQLDVRIGCIFHPSMELNNKARKLDQIFFFSN